MANTCSHRARTEDAYTHRGHGEWRSLVAHPAGGRAVAGSNPVSPIMRTSAHPGGDSGVLDDPEGDPLLVEDAAAVLARRLAAGGDRCGTGQAVPAAAPERLAGEGPEADAAVGARPDTFARRGDAACRLAGG